MQVNTKSLKKQLAAAIAMLLVAVVALGTATYAWFVTNNRVDATTSTISAQSNAAFLYIREENEGSTDFISDESEVRSIALFPAHWALTSESATYPDAGNFYKAYGKDPTKKDMDSNTLEKIKCDSCTDGTPEAAVGSTYAVENTFYVGAKGRQLTDLIVDQSNTGITLDGTSANNSLDSALRILVKCGDNWVLCNNNSVLGASNNQNKLADAVTPDSEVEIKVYLFYDGEDTNIYTNNLESLKLESKKIKVTFTATADNK